MFAQRVMLFGLTLPLGACSFSIAPEFESSLYLPLGSFDASCADSESSDGDAYGGALHSVTAVDGDRCRVQTKWSGALIDALDIQELIDDYGIDTSMLRIKARGADVTIDDLTVERDGDSTVMPADMVALAAIQAESCDRGGSVPFDDCTAGGDYLDVSLAGDGSSQATVDDAELTDSMQDSWDAWVEDSQVELEPLMGWVFAESTVPLAALPGLADSSWGAEVEVTVELDIALRWPE